MAFIYILVKGDYLSVNRENFLIVFINIYDAPNTDAYYGYLRHNG